jgi:hypothetical protein
VLACPVFWNDRQPTSHPPAAAALCCRPSLDVPTSAVITLRTVCGSAPAHHCRIATCDPLKHQGAQWLGEIGVCWLSLMATLEPLPTGSQFLLATAQSNALTGLPPAA